MSRNRKMQYLCRFLCGVVFVITLIHGLQVMYSNPTTLLSFWDVLSLGSVTIVTILGLAVLFCVVVKFVNWTFVEDDKESLIQYFKNSGWGRME